MPWQVGSSIHLRPWLSLKSAAPPGVTQASRNTMASRVFMVGLSIRNEHTSRAMHRPAGYRDRRITTNSPPPPAGSWAAPFVYQYKQGDKKDCLYTANPKDGNEKLIDCRTIT